MINLSTSAFCEAKPSPAHSAEPATVCQHLPAFATVCHPRDRTFSLIFVRRQRAKPIFRTSQAKIAPRIPKMTVKNSKKHPRTSPSGPPRPQNGLPHPQDGLPRPPQWPPRSPKLHFRPSLATKITFKSTKDNPNERQLVQESSRDVMEWMPRVEIQDNTCLPQNDESKMRGRR